MMKKCSCILKTAAALVSAVLLAAPAAAGPLCYEDEYIGLIDQNGNRLKKLLPFSD